MLAEHPSSAQGATLLAYELVRWARQRRSQRNGRALRSSLQLLLLMRRVAEDLGVKRA